MIDINDAAELVAAARAKAGLSQRELAVRAHTTQAAVARIEGGDSNPTLRTVASLVAAAGFAVRIDLAPRAAPNAIVEAYKRDIDRSLLRENLRKTPEQRLRSLTALARLAHEARRAGRAATAARRARR